MSIARYYDVIQNSNPEDLTCLRQLLVNAKISLAWFWFTGGVVVGKDNRGCAISDDISEHFAGMNGAVVQKPNRHNALLDNLVCAVQ